MQYTSDTAGPRVIHLSFGTSRSGGAASQALRDRGYEIVLAGPYTAGATAAHAAIQEDVDAAYCDMRTGGVEPLNDFIAELDRYDRGDMQTIAHVPTPQYGEAAQYADAVIAEEQDGSTAACYLEADGWQDLPGIGEATEAALEDAGLTFGTTRPQDVTAALEDAGMGAAHIARIKQENAAFFGAD